MAEPLDDPRHERFAQSLSQGFKPLDAYVMAGFVASPDSLSASSSRLASHFTVRRRVRELLEPTLRKHRITAERLLQEYATLAYANMGDYYKDDENGEPQFDYGACTRAMKAAIAEITVEEYKDKRSGRDIKSTKFKLHDKRGAMADLAKYLRLIGGDTVNLNVMNIENLKGPDRDALEQAVAALLEKQSVTPALPQTPLIEHEPSNNSDLDE